MSQNEGGNNILGLYNVQTRCKNATLCLFQFRFDALGAFKLFVLNNTSSHSASFT